MKTLQQAAEEHKRALWQAAIAESRSEFERERPFKVTLCCMIFSEIEVAGTIHTVDRIAEQQADKAAVVMHCVPHAMRYQVQKRSDPKNPESPLEWVEVVHAQLDPNDPGSPRLWRLKS